MYYNLLFSVVLTTSITSLLTTTTASSLPKAECQYKLTHILITVGVAIGFDGGFIVVFLCCCWKRKHKRSKDTERLKTENIEQIENGTPCVANKNTMPEASGFAHNFGFTNENVTLQKSVATYSGFRNENVTPRKGLIRNVTSNDGSEML